MLHWFMALTLVQSQAGRTHPAWIRREKRLWDGLGHPGSS